MSKCPKIAFTTVVSVTEVIHYQLTTPICKRSIVSALLACPIQQLHKERTVDKPIDYIFFAAIFQL